MKMEMPYFLSLMASITLPEKNTWYILQFGLILNNALIVTIYKLEKYK